MNLFELFEEGKYNYFIPCIFSNWFWFSSLIYVIMFSDNEVTFYKEYHYFIGFFNHCASLILRMGPVMGES